MLRLSGFWYIAAPSAELRNRPIRREVEGEPLALFRDAAGRARALLDRCAHRGMALSQGRVAGDCLQCPYHGWTYDGRGALWSVPALPDGESTPRVSLRSFPVVEQDDHLWVWLGAEPPSSGPCRFPYHGEPGWRTFFMHTRFAAPVEACLENFLDVPHTQFVHPGLFRGPAPRPTRVAVERDADGVTAIFLDEAPLQGLGPRLMFPKGATMRHTDRFLLPSISRVDYAFGDEHRFVITSQCTQRADDVTDVTTAITWRLPVPGWIARPFLRWYCGRVIRQDVDILKIQGEQLRRFGPAMTNTEADVLGPHIRDLRRRAAEGPAVPVEARCEVVMRV